MFNNKFLKNDPLLEAVKQAQAEGAMRREAEKIVNEEFGVYSRKAVVREHLAAYDARVEQTYVELKEGITIEPSEINPVPRKPQVGSGNVPHQTGSGQTVNPKDNKEIAVEALDPVGKVDSAGDINNNGIPAKRDKSDQYLLHRRAVRSAAIREGSAMDPKDPSVQGSRDVTSTPPAKPMAKKAPNDPSVQGSGDVTMGGKPARIDELSKKTLGSYIKSASHDARQRGAAYVGSGDVKHLRKGYHRVRGIEKAVDRLAKEETQLDELSRKTLGSYAKKASAQASDANYGRGIADANPATRHIPQLDKKARKRDQGVQRAISKLAKEETQLSELNRSTLVSYIRKAAKAKATPENISKRGKGMEMAGKKIEKMEEDRSFKSARVTESNKLSLGKSVNEVAMSMPPVVAQPAIAGQRMPGIIKRSGTATGSFVKPTTATANQPNPSAAAKTTMQRGMSAAGQEASKLVKPPAPYERIAQQAATKAPGIVGAASRFAANPIVGGVAMAMDPTPANQGENEFARQAKYAPKTTPGSMNISKQPAPTVSTSAAAEKVGISQTAKPSVAPAAAQAKPSVKQSFSQAYRAAREAGGSKAQFEYGGKQYQAAAKKSEYVPMSKQVKVDTETKPTVTQAEPKAQSPGPSTPATASWKDQGAAEKERMAKEKPVTAPTPNVPSVNDTSADVSGRTAFTQSPKYSMPKDMKGEYSGAPATSIPSSGTRFRMPKEMGGSFAMSEGSDKEPKPTEPKEIGKYDFTNIMPVMKPEDIKKSKELTATPKIRNMQESVQVGSNKYRIV